MLFYSFFKTMVGHEVVVELKNDIQLRGKLVSIDQFLNVKIDDVAVVDDARYPHLASIKNGFIRGSVIRYIHLPPEHVDTVLLQDAARRELAA